VGNLKRIPVSRCNKDQELLLVREWQARAVDVIRQVYWQVADQLGRVGPNCLFKVDSEVVRSEIVLSSEKTAANSKKKEREQKTDLG
jgi:hypothetical protein